MFYRFASALSALLLSGCAIHPLPEDVTGVGTRDIVQQIRCEARNTVIDNLVRYLDRLGTDYLIQNVSVPYVQPGIPLARQLAEQYRRDPDATSGFKASLFKAPDEDKIREVLNVFLSVGIAYNFELTMTEENNLSAGTANFKETFHRSVFTLGVGAGAARKRNNFRTFTVTDTFAFLLSGLNAQGADGRRGCDGLIVQENYVYPIAGRVGVDKVIHDFMNLTFFGGLGEKGKPNGPPAMADKLTFTTALDASATPKIVFTPTGTAFQLTDAIITGSLKRTDVHEVTIGLAIPPSSVTSLSDVRSFLYPGAPRIAGGTTTAAAAKRNSPAAAAGTLVGTRVIGRGTPAEALALSAIDQLKSREFQLVQSP